MALVTCPPSVWMGRSSNPGLAVGTRNSVSPLCLGAPALVRARTNTWLATCAVLVNIFCPLITQPAEALSVTRTAVVLADATSEPESGSL